MSDGLKDYRLPNGLRVGLERRRNGTVSCAIRFHHGAAHEKPEEYGIAHFLEHVLLDGGSHRYDAARSSDILNQCVERNATTAMLGTLYYMNSLPGDLEPWINVVSTTLAAPLLDQSRVDMERKAILRELADMRCGVGYRSKKVLGKLWYRTEDPRSQHDVGGDEEVVKHATPHQLRSFFARGYHPNNAELVIVGDFPRNIEGIIEDVFGSLPPGTGKPYEFSCPPGVDAPTYRFFKHPQLINERDPNQSTATFSLVMCAPGAESADRASFTVLNSILGEGETSQLFRRIREEKGLAYEVRSSYFKEKNEGSLTINAAVPARLVQHSIDTIFDVMGEVAAKGVNGKEITRVRKRISYQLKTEDESNSGKCSDILSRFNGSVEKDAFVRAVMKVTRSDVQRAAQTYLPSKTGTYLLAVYHPFEGD